MDLSSAVISSFQSFSGQSLSGNFLTAGASRQVGFPLLDLDFLSLIHQEDPLPKPEPKPEDLSETLPLPEVLLADVLDQPLLTGSKTPLARSESLSVPFFQPLEAVVKSKLQKLSEKSVKSKPLFSEDPVNSLLPLPAIPIQLLPLPFQVILQQQLRQQGPEASAVGSHRTLKLPSGLSEKIIKAYKHLQPLRVEIDDAHAVILRFAQGKVSAEFISQDPALAETLKQQLAGFKAQLESQNLPVGDLDARYEENPSNAQQQHSKSSHPDSDPQPRS